MIKQVLIVSILFFSYVFALNEYATVVLKNVTSGAPAGKVNIIYSGGTLTFLISHTGGDIAASFAVLNHGDLTKNASISDTYGLGNVNTCNKIGYLGSSTKNVTTLNSSSLNITSIQSIIGLAFGIFQGEACSVTRDLESVTTSYFDPLYWGVIGIGNTAFAPTDSPFNNLNISAPSDSCVDTNDQQYYGTCVLTSTAKSTGITGIVYISINENLNQSTITAQISGLTKDSVHGIHIHSFGDLTSSEASVGGHWKNATQVHALPNNPNREYGDLGNVCQYDGNVAYYKYQTNYLPISGINNVIGRSIVIHQNRDNGSTSSFGNRIAWCTIGQSSNTAPFVLPSLTFDDPPVCGPVETPTPSPSESSESSDPSDSSKVYISIFLIISTLLVLLI